MFDKLILLFLGIFDILFGIYKVTNFQIVWGEPVMGLAALILGIICLIRLIVLQTTKR